MTLIALIGALAGVGVIAALVRRHTADERHAMRDYQQTLETLRHMADRRAGELGTTDRRIRRDPARRATTRLASSAGPRRPPTDAPGTGSPTDWPRTGSRADGPRTASRPRPTGPARRPAASPRRSARAPAGASSSSPAPGAPAPAAVVASGSAPPAVTARVDAAPARVTEPSGSSARQQSVVFDDTAAVPGAEPAQRAVAASARSLAGSPPLRMRRRQVGSPLLVAAAVAVVAGGVGIGIALSSAGSPRHTVADSARTPALSTKPASSAPAAVTPASATTSSAVYDMTGPFIMTLAAVGPCWVQATDVTGHVVWSGTMEAGQSQTLSLGPGSSLRLGAAGNARLSVAGRSLQLPVGFVSPFDVSFRSA